MKPPILAAIVAGLLLNPIVKIGAEELSPEEVKRAMEKGVTYLNENQRPDGTWPEYGGQDGGITCLCTLALLNAGEKPNDDPRYYINKALDSVRKLPAKTTYVVALQTMVLCRA